MKISIIRCTAVVIFLSLFLKAFPQTDKGKFMFGGQYVLNYTSYTSTFKGSNNSYEIGKYRTFGISPQIGFLIVRNFGAGIGLLYSYGKTTQGSSDSHSSGTSLVPFLQYYFGQSKIKPYLQMGAGPGWQKTTSTDFGYTNISNTKIFTYQFKGGVCAFINDYISLDFSIGYKSITENFAYHTSGADIKSKVVNKGLHTIIGFVVYL